MLAVTARRLSPDANVGLDLAGAVPGKNKVMSPPVVVSVLDPARLGINSTRTSPPEVRASTEPALSRKMMSPPEVLAVMVPLAPRASISPPEVSSDADRFTVRSSM
ncbi:MAG: hypothetical protein N0A16_13470 [Blastocatellia bacterium]|nr:hypothetical protein [Blastocatellia bacterium]